VRTKKEGLVNQTEGKKAVLEELCQKIEICLSTGANKDEREAQNPRRRNYLRWTLTFHSKKPCWTMERLPELEHIEGKP